MHQLMNLKPQLRRIQAAKAGYYFKTVPVLPVLQRARAKPYLRLRAFPFGDRRCSARSRQGEAAETLVLNLVGPVRVVERLAGGRKAGRGALPDLSVAGAAIRPELTLTVSRQHRRTPGHPCGGSGAFVCRVRKGFSPIPSERRKNDARRHAEHSSRVARPHTRLSGTRYAPIRQRSCGVPQTRG